MVFQVRRCSMMLLLVWLVSGCPESASGGLEEHEMEGVRPAVDPDGDGLAGERERFLGTDPTLADTDGDGVGDGVEVALGTNPLLADASVCATEVYRADGSTRPVDVIVVLDNSGSMREEIDAIEEHINDSFASLLVEGGLDFRLIVIGTHGEGTVFDSDICVRAPLSGSTCDPVPSQPAISERFFQYDTEVQSDDAFERVLSTYRSGDRHGLAPDGWRQWLRDEAFKVFVQFSDDESQKEFGGLAPTADHFDAALLGLAPPHFGQPGSRNYRWHAIVGIAAKGDGDASAYGPEESLVAERCPTAETPGLAYQRLSVVTGGLRYPVCQVEGYDAVFRAAAESILEDAKIPCSIRLGPADPGLDIPFSAVGIGSGPDPRSG